MDDLDTIMSGRDAAASETPEAVEKETQAAAVDTAATEQTEQTGQEGEQSQKMVPHEALHAEKQKVKRYTEQVASFENTMAEQAAAVRRLEQQLLAAVVPQQSKAEAPKPKPDIWDNPDEFVQSGVQAALSPFQTEVQKTLHGIAKDAAYGRYGEAVDAAEQAFMQAVQTGTVDAAEFDKVLKAPNRYSAAVEWHKREQERAELADPATLKEKLRAEILAELQASQAQQQQQQPAARQPMPTSFATSRSEGMRAQPTYSGPKPLSEIMDR